jgi:periplasmic protein CpxP/Spy
MSKKTQLLVLSFALILAVSWVPAIAQGTTDQASTMAADQETKAKVQAGLQHLATELNLTEDQKAKIKPVLQNEFAQLKAVNADSSLSADQRQSKVTEIRGSAKSQIQSILTPEQQQKFAAMKEEWQEKRQ